MGLGRLKPKFLLRKKAADLLARLDVDPSPENAERLERWRASDPRNAEALRVSEAMLRTARLLPEPPGSAQAPKRAVDRRERAFSKRALAASIGAVLILVSALYFAGGLGPAAVPVQAVMLSTSVGEVRQVPLADGSSVILDTASAVRIDIASGRRSATLERGRARFSVARSDAPFTVQAADAALRLDSGVVEVSRIGGKARVELIAGEGKLLAPGGPSAERPLKAPIALDRPGTLNESASRPARPPVDWTSGRLSFDGARLDHVVAAANRYSARKILLSDPAIAGLRVTGVYKAGDPDALAAALASAFGLEARRDAAGNIRLERSAARKKRGG